MRLRARTTATTLAAAALALGGVTAGASPASADTGVHCAASLLNVVVYACDAPVGSGAPYTFHVDVEYYYVGVGGGLFGSYMPIDHDVVLVCQTATQTDATTWQVNPQSPNCITG
ncbi:hypothetical protein K353_06575 [Kitasatospora sp. SolWspMP-SS2h]|uniref:hypothetical protein n=1 Tax=Kitasatospora sp. SolWspMP-SS2h TaxID=1305729 RepID=UPI000DB8FED4|nr:hypothetical protein [Kitasatospora sp. SolWspMP-SS2h]RAJ29687.1 hypothetical protein K353_06575 [Kitasatospora sp. SolWspMP-SS2h]